MNARATSFFGAVFALVGVACWVAARSAWGPPDISQLDEAEPRLGGLDVRWACVGLALAGLLLLARSDRASVRLAFGAAGVWLAADVAVDLSIVDSAVAAWLVGAAIVGVVATVASRPAARTSTSPRSLVVYGGVLLGVVPTSTSGLQPSLFSAVRPVGVVLPIMLAIAAVVLAVAARPRVGGFTAVAAFVVGVLVAAGFFAVTAGAGAVNEETLEFPEASEQLATLLRPVAMVALVCLAGLTPRTPMRVLGLVGLVPLAFLWALMGLAPWTFIFPWDQPWEPYAHVAMTVLAGVASGLVTTALASVVAQRRLAEDDASVDVDAPAVWLAAGGRRDWRLALAASLTVAGLIAWTIMAAVIDPAIRDVVHGWRTAPPGPDGYIIWPGGVEGTQRFEMLGRDARWATIVLGIAGLALALRCGVWWLRLAVGMGTWLVAEWYLDAIDLRGLPAAGVAVAAATVVVWAIAGRPYVRSRKAEPAPWLIVYSGVCLAVGAVLLWWVKPWMTEYLAAGTIAVIVALTVSLVVAGILLALAVAPHVDRGRVWLATGLLLYGVTGVLFVDARSLLVGDGWVWFATLFVVPLALTTASLAGVVRTTAARWVMAGAGAASVVATPLAWYAGALLALFATYQALPLIGSGFDPTESISTTWLGIGGGAVLALLALLPWTERPAGARADPAVPHAPTIAPPTPLRPGKPDILEWPEPARR